MSSKILRFEKLLTMIRAALEGLGRGCTFKNGAPVPATRGQLLSAIGRALDELDAVESPWPCWEPEEREFALRTLHDWYDGESISDLGIARNVSAIPTTPGTPTVSITGPMCR